MARRKKTTSADSHPLDRIALLPWWAGLLLALGAFALLRFVAATSRGTAADIAQYAAPAVFVVISGISAWRRSQRDSASPTPSERGTRTQALDRLSLDDFQVLLGDAFRLQGYQVVDNTGGGAGGRVDMVLRRERETFLVLCKHWKESRIGVEAVQQLQRAMSTRNALGGFIVTIGRFSRDATSYASGCNVRLIDGRVLHGMVERVRADPSRTLVAAP
jgi:restriction system protein